MSYFVRLGKHRDPVVYLVVSVVTGGLFFLYWWYKLCDDLNEAGPESARQSFVVELLLTIITCGLYGWFWLPYKYAKRLEDFERSLDLPPHELTFPLVIMGIFAPGVGHWVGAMLMQDRLNNLWRRLHAAVA